MAPLSFMNFCTLNGLHSLCYLDDDILDYCKLSYNENDLYQMNVITKKMSELFNEIIELHKLGSITQRSINHALGRARTKEQFEKLISIGACAKSNDSECLMQASICLNDIEIVKFLLERGADHKSGGYKALCESLIFHKGDVVNHLFNLMINDIDINEPTSNEVFEKVYKYAVIGKNKDIIKKLCLLGHKYNITSDLIKEGPWSCEVSPDIKEYISSLGSYNEILVN